MSEYKSRFVLIKDYGREGLTVCGITDLEFAAKIWQAGGSENDYVTVERDTTPDPSGLIQNRLLPKEQQ